MQFNLKTPSPDTMPFIACVVCGVALMFHYKIMALCVIYIFMGLWLVTEKYGRPAADALGLKILWWPLWLYRKSKEKENNDTIE